MESEKKFALSICSTTQAVFTTQKKDRALLITLTDHCNTAQMGACVCLLFIHQFLLFVLLLFFVFFNALVE